MIRKSLLLIACLTSLGVMAQSHYKVDPAHSSVNFKVKHSGITFVSGRFDTFDGGFIGNIDQMEKARVFFNVETASINTAVARRDDHLRSADFFDVEKFRTMTFESTAIRKVDEKRYRLEGKLQIKDVTRDVHFDVYYGGAVQGEDGSETVGFIAKNKINRLEYNISYDPEGMGIGKEVTITLYLEFKSVQ